MDMSNWLSAVLGAVIAAFILSGGFAVFGKGYIKEMIGNRLRERADTFRQQNEDFGWGNGFDPPGRFIKDHSNDDPGDGGFDDDSFDNDDDEEDDDE